MVNFAHTPVLLQEVIDGLKVEMGKKYIDATLGGGGHTAEILRLGGIVLGIDQDEDALNFVKEKFSKEVLNKSLKVRKGNFKDIRKLAYENGFGTADGILFDLGVSSYQLDSPIRGFSLKHNSRLDMRMDKDQQLSAYEVINKYPFETLIEIFLKNGEEHNARKIAERIVETRKKQPIETTGELSLLIEKVSHKSEGIHPATKTFQAIRIEVNKEIDSLRIGISEAFDLLGINGRITVISFHSLEDRVVKLAFDKFQRAGLGTVLTKSPLMASFSENARNKRSRSAKLRIFEKK